MKRNEKVAEAAKLLIKVLAKTTLVMWSFFDFSVWSLGVVLLIPFEIRKERKKREKEKVWQLNLAFKDALLYLRNALSAGYAPESSMKAALKGLEQLYTPDHSLCIQFRKMISKMEMGNSMEEVWVAFGEKSGSEEIRQFAETLSVVKRTGGEVGTVIRMTGDIIQEKVELKRELYTALASKETEFRIMSMIPQGMLLYLQLFAPSMSEGLYHNAFGIGFMWCVFLAYTGIRLVGERMLQREIAGER